MRLLSIFCGIICVFGGECVNWRAEFLKNDPTKQLRRRVLMEEVPESDEEARRYVKIYEEDISNSTGLQSGILAARYFIDNKKFEDAAGLLSRIVPTVSSLQIDSDFRRHFARQISCADRLLSEYAKNRNTDFAEIVRSASSERVEFGAQRDVESVN